MIHRRRKTRCAGLTFMELLLSLSITAMIGAGIAAMLTAVSYGTAQGKDMRSLVVKNKTLGARFTAAIRNASMMLERGNDYAVLWLNDDNAGGTPNLGEIQYLAYDATNDRITSYTVDWTGMNQAQIDAANTEFQLTDNFATVMASELGSSHYPAKVWANGVTSWAVTVNNADEQLATLASFQFDLTHQEMTDTLIGAAGLRNK